VLAALPWLLAPGHQEPFSQQSRCLRVAQHAQLKILLNISYLMLFNKENMTPKPL
jgi:hypothetical protein